MSNTAASYQMGAGRFKPWLFVNCYSCYCCCPVAVNKEPRLETSCTHLIRSCSIAHQIHFAKLWHIQMQLWASTKSCHYLHNKCLPPWMPCAFTYSTREVVQSRNGRIISFNCTNFVHVHLLDVVWWPSNKLSTCAVVHHLKPAVQARQNFINKINPSQWCFTRWSLHSLGSVL